MSLDKNQYCPCGTGKKIKFCCKDIAKSLDKIARAIEGQQFEAAMQMLDKGIEEHPNRAAFWAIKTTALMQTGQFDASEEAVAEFLSFAPENPIALAASAVLKVTTMAPPAEGDDPEAFAAAQANVINAATATLHRALAHSPAQMPVQVFEAVGLIGQFLIETGHVLAGREHLLFQYAVSPDQAERSAKLLVETSRSREVPLLFKQESSLPAPADWVQWKEDYAAARELALRGAWTPAANQIKALIDANDPHPVLLRAYATLCCRLPDETVAAEALRAVVTFKDVELDDAVEAEALALLLDTNNQGEMVDVLLVSVPIENAESAMEKLQSDRRSETLRVDFSDMASDDKPPPKAGFMLLDREMPASPDALTAEAVPHAYCESVLYGKETDRAARMEMMCSRSQWEALRPMLKDLLGDDIAGEADEKVLNQMPANIDKMTVKPMFPRDTPRDFQLQYVRDVERRQLFDVWPNLVQPGLNGKTAKQASEDPASERQLLGALLNLQVRRGAKLDPAEFQSLRKQLGVADPTMLSPKPGDARRLPLVRLERVDPTTINSEDLAVNFVRASQNGMSAVVIKFGTELIERDAQDMGLNKAEVFGRMAQNTDDSNQAIEWLEKAQAECRAAGESPAAWMISEMTYRIIAGQGAEAQALMTKIQTEHMEEPGVAQMLMQTLQQLGIVGPGGMPRQAPGAGGPPAAANAPGTPPPAASAGNAGQGGLWTPDGQSSPQPTQPAKDGKSAIWTPGME